MKRATHFLRLVWRAPWRSPDFGSPLISGPSSAPVRLDHDVLLACCPVGPDADTVAERLEEPMPRIVRWSIAKLSAMLGIALAGSTPAAGVDGAQVLRSQGDAVVARATGATSCAIMPDDGGYESAVGFMESQTASNLAQRFEVPPPSGDRAWFLDDICLGLTLNGPAAESTFTFAVFRDDGGLPGELLGFRQVTAPIPGFPSSTICAGDFALPLIGLDAIHAGLAWNPKLVPLFLNMDESAATPLQIVSARASSSGPDGLGGWSSATVIDPAIRAAGIGITLFSSKPQWTTTNLAKPPSVPLNDAVPILGGVGLDRGHEFQALVVYPGQTPTSPQTFVWVQGAPDVPGQAESMVLDMPFERAVSVGRILPDPADPNSSRFTVISSNLEVWTGDVRPAGGGRSRTAQRRGEFDVALGKHSLDAGSAYTKAEADLVKSGDVTSRRLTAFNQSRKRVELWTESAQGDLHLSRTAGDGNVVSTGALRPGATFVDRGGSDPWWCPHWAEDGGGSGTILIKRKCGPHQPQAVTWNTDKFGPTRDLYVVDRPVSRGPDFDLNNLLGLPEFTQRSFAFLQGQDGDVNVLCGVIGDGGFEPTGSQQLFPVNPQFSSLIAVQPAGDHVVDLSYLNLEGDRFERRYATYVAPPCEWSYSDPEPLAGASGGRPIAFIPEIENERERHGSGSSSWRDRIYFWGTSSALQSEGSDPRAAAPVSRLTLAQRRVPRPCLPGPGAHCLGDGRFEVAVDWRKQDNETGIGRRIDLTDDSGLFYFFDEDNVELITKVLPSCGPPFNSFWVFSAGLTDVEYQMEVFDSQTGRRRWYTNPLKTPAAPVQDTSAFKPCGGGASSAVAATDAASWALPSWARDALRAGGSHRPRSAAPRAGDCTPGPTRLCLEGGRFQVDVDWMTKSGNSGPGRSIDLTDDTGAFWFFDDDNVEVLVKVLDACGGPFNSFWVFAAGLTNVEVTLTVTDTQSGASKVYENPLERPFQPIQDTTAFATCP